MTTELPKEERPGGFIRGFGPGLVSGASANDPTTVGSIAVVAAATGYGLAWLVVLLLPMLAVVQSIAASVAAGSQMSLQQAIAKTYGRAPALVAALAIVGIGVCTLGADVQAGAQALTLLTGIPFAYFVLPLVGIATWMLATKSYLKIERALASLTLIFLCYVASAILARPNWFDVLRGIVAPHVSLTPAFATGALALLGTTLTGYVYFWESIEVAERRPEPAQFAALNSDAILGMLVAGSSFLFILIASAAAFGSRGQTIRTAADAAVALRPLVGAWDAKLFGIGLLASAAIAIPVIAATNGYVVAQTFGWNAGLTETPRAARGFYGAIYATLAAAGGIALIPIATMSLLYWASVAAGLATPITLALTMLVARDEGLMQGRPVSRAVASAGWTVTGIVTLSSLAFLVSAMRR